METGERRGRLEGAGLGSFGEGVTGRWAAMRTGVNRPAAISSAAIRPDAIPMAMNRPAAVSSGAIRPAAIPRAMNRLAAI